MSTSPQRRAARSLVGLNGRPIVVTAAGAADFLPADEGQVLAAIQAAGLPPWGADAQDRPVWRLREIEGLFGVEVPEPRRGQGWRAAPIPNTRGDHRCQRAALQDQAVEDLAAGDVPAWSVEEALKG